MGRGRNKKGSFPSPLSDLLHETLRGKAAAKRIREGRIWEVWQEAVGKQMASRAYPLKISDGILTVAVTTSSWMQQMNFLKQEIRDKVNECLGEELVREIFLKQGKVATPAEPAVPRPRLRSLTGEENRFVEEETSCIDDPEIRQALRRLMTRHLGLRQQ